MPATACPTAALERVCPHECAMRPHLGAGAGGPPAYTPNATLTAPTAIITAMALTSRRRWAAAATASGGQEARRPWQLGVFLRATASEPAPYSAAASIMQPFLTSTAVYMLSTPSQQAPAWRCARQLGHCRPHSS
eukprot:jgi/Ulvmu1/1100/UM106_0017.1